MTASFSPFDTLMMQKALELAQKGQFTTKPNPMVGCVLTQGDRIIGEGWHQKAGLPHAEREALTNALDAGEDVKGCTVYVTLEPCSHFGRTPPCADALIDAQVSRVVVAMQDPNPNVSGQGIQRMQDAGIQVDVGLESDKAEQLNQGFCFAMRNERPFVRLKNAISLDGRTALSNGKSQWITGSEARKAGHFLRAQAGAILTGIETVLADDPRLNVRIADFDTNEKSRSLSNDEQFVHPLRVVLDTHFRMPKEARMLQLTDVETLVLTSESAFHNEQSKVEALKEKGVHVEPVALNAVGDRLSLEAVLHYLHAKHHINQVLVEAGSSISGSFLQQDLVDELHVFMAPKLLGSDAKPFAVLPLIKDISETLTYEFLDIRKLGQDVHLILKPTLFKSTVF